ncbi:NusG domain II-containing protein [Fusobacterium perfoetens]|uniref:NusG domain II-containing protein n=1 Tax=Fusobacterium perfoetens TaxID=852 RepID=UPI00048A0D00|nr:NusG domain II-containing protein [Fusobacterium perfoetens]MCI6152359.1 NusG domain II-containing protein [Fusobacterium perfoetens]MDY3236958.1 NusG domain II-containing protein [Fusobacterium perfoetens]
MKRKPCYFRKWDILIYIVIFSIFLILFLHVQNLKTIKGNKAEIYVDNQLKYVFNLQEEKKEFFVDTNLGGVNVLIEKMKIRVTTSNSPLKICVKQGWISNVGDTIVGIPDRLLIKIVGITTEDDVDATAR